MSQAFFQGIIIDQNWWHIGAALRKALVFVSLLATGRWALQSLLFLAI